MWKGENLWDDSALLKAFDDAISNYKIIHNANNTNLTSTDAQQTHGPISDAEENNNVVSNTLTTRGVGEAENISLLQQDHPLQSVDSLSGQHTQAVIDYSQNLEAYNQLLNQYYELEEKRQMVLHQLYQFGGYDYQTSNVAFGSTQQLANCNTSLPTVACSCCCPYASHCSEAPCTSFQCCSQAGTCASKPCDHSSSLTCHEKSAPLTDGDVVKTAMAAAEKALSSIKLTESTNSSQDEKEKGKDSVDGIAQSMSSETDLSLVLNAWYSAGFYTGKYLTEQSKKGK
ncbi:hypothetical protein M5689_010766 [Euphorbia peplus]|nr:hypothetical protein M5689_010766 [Euphorbia peplus]